MRQLLPLLFLATAARAQSSDPEEAFQRYRSSHQKKLDDASLTTMTRLKLAWDSVKGTPWLEPVDIAISAGQTPYVLIAGETVWDGVQRTIRERSEKSLRAALHEAIGENLDDADEQGSISAGE